MTRVLTPLAGPVPGGDAGVGGGGQSGWRRFVAGLPMRVSLLAVGVVWLLGCAWSFQEQSAFAGSKGFAFPHLLPLVIDGFAVSMAGVSWAASLDARPAIPARLATVVAVGASAASNGVWAWLRTHHDAVTVVLGMAVPVAANLAFEVLLAELRRQVQRRRGLPPPVAVPYPRVIRLVLAPWQTFRTWRVLVLELTAMEQALDPAAGRGVSPAGDDALGLITGPAAEECTPTPELSASDAPAGQESTVAAAEPSTAEQDTDRDAEQDAEQDADRLAERARLIVTGSPEPMGRRRLARELAVSEHTARRLLARLDAHDHGPDQAERDQAERDQAERDQAGQEQQHERGLFALSGMGERR